MKAQECWADLAMKSVSFSQHPHQTGLNHLDFSYAGPETCFRPM